MYSNVGYLLKPKIYTNLKMSELNISTAAKRF